MTEQEFNANKFALDDWTKVYPAPTAVPFELKQTGSTFRGMNDREKAISYANEVAGYFTTHHLDLPVFVVAGPTSTTRKKFEVVTTTAGYHVVYRTRSTGQKVKSVSDPLTAPQLKCSAKDCLNHSDEGVFVGLLCLPCHRFVSGEDDSDHSLAAKRAARLPSLASKAVLEALEGLLANQIACCKVSGFTEVQIRAMPYLKPSFEAVRLAKS